MASSPDSNTTASNSTAPGGLYFYDESTSRFNSTNAAVIISLVGGCVVLAFVSVILRKYLRRAAGVTMMQPSTAQSDTTQSGTYAVKPKGLQKMDLDALPLVEREDLGEEDSPHDCPVCLSNFEAEDSLRLLPTCKHVFHRECIDAWFDAHSTCPLCRSSLVAESVGEEKSSNSGGEPVAAVGGHGELVETITEVSESGDSDIESRQHTPNAASIEDSRTSILISPEDSVGGALFRNSQSLKRVTTGSEQQPNSTKNATFRKPPASPSIRRSSSLSVDLIALHNLLIRQSDQTVDGPARRWFSRARSFDMAPRDRSEGDNWITIDLEAGTAADNLDAQVPSSSSSRRSEAEVPKGPPERAWLDRWSMASMKGAVVSPLTRSTSHGSLRSAHLPM